MSCVIKIGSFLIEIKLDLIRNSGLVVCCWLDLLYDLKSKVLKYIKYWCDLNKLLLQL